MRVYVILDRVAQDFSNPFVAKTDGVACRAYADVVKSAKSPDEYELYCIGEYDSSIGVFTPEPKYKIEVAV